MPPRKIYHIRVPNDEIVPSEDSYLYYIEGPFEERQKIKTPYGDAWAEAGTYIAENIKTGDKHVVHPDDLKLQYAEKIEEQRVPRLTEIVDE